MKKVLSIIIAVCLALSLCACFGMSVEEKTQAYNEFVASVKDNGVYAFNARIETDEDGNKMLMADIVNNTSYNVSNIVISYAVWDGEGNPIIIKTPKNPDNTYSIFEVTLSNVEVAAGETWQADMGLVISEECYNIAYIEAMVISCELDASAWENDLYEKWQETYVGVALEEWMEVSSDKQDEADDASSDTESGSATGLEAGLLAQKAVAINPKKQPQSNGTIMLTADITNNTKGTVSGITLAFTVWDSEGKPLLIKSASGLTEDSYIKEVDMGELSIEAETTWEADLGLRVSEEMENIVYVEAIVVSFADADGKIWENPLYDSWSLAFEGKDYPVSADDETQS